MKIGVAIYNNFCYNNNGSNNIVLGGLVVKKFFVLETVADMRGKDFTCEKYEVGENLTRAELWALREILRKTALRCKMEVLSAMKEDRFSDTVTAYTEYITVESLAVKLLNADADVFEASVSEEARKVLERLDHERAED